MATVGSQQTWSRQGLLGMVLGASLAVCGCGSDGASDDGDEAVSPTTMAATAVGVAVDPYGTDPFVGRGTREEVCRGGEAANRRGRAALAAYLQVEWAGVEKVLGFECRELFDPTTAGCDREVEPAYSECWSMHATGQAIDIVVGGEPDAPTAEGIALGDRIVSAFLAEKDGVKHYLARVTGVQEIIWNDRCWRIEDQHVVRAEEMDACSIPGHDNHVHLTLSNAGADGLTSWYGTRP